MVSGKCSRHHLREISALFCYRLALATFFVLSIMGRVQADALSELSGALAAISTYQASFRQTIYGQDGKRLQESRGILYAARPGKLRWAAETPFAQLIVVDGVNIWRYEADLEQVIVSDYTGDLGTTPALLLSGDVNSIAQSYQVKQAGKQYSLVPRTDDSLFRSMLVTLDDGVLTRLQLKDSLGQTTVLALSDIESNPELDPALFTFEPPAGVDILRNE